ncbi:hypothetical protein LTR17_025711 [Elasticomyces elasticus]|nr:hypothetical protein LTR17_025711 [Elasticomyces elasticus]
MVAPESRATEISLRIPQMYLVADKASSTRVPFTVVGSNARLLDSPVSTTHLDISVAERREVVEDLTKSAGQNTTFE